MKRVYCPLQSSQAPVQSASSSTGFGCALQGMAFGWELTMTFLLVAVVYAVAIGKPSFIETGPLAVGFTLWASASVGGCI